MFLLLTMMQLSARTYGQQITLNTQNSTLEQVLESIKKQTDYVFIYNNKTVRKLVVNVKAENASIEEVMQQCLQNKPFSFKILGKSVLIKELAAASVAMNDNTKQAKIIKGTVLGVGSLPLPGVSVKIKGAQTGTTTNNDGIFTINVPDDQAVLVFSMVGYGTQEISLGTESTLTVTLQEVASDLDEVVVVGYGEQKKVNLTGAVTQISAENFQDRPVTELTQALQGQIPNLNVTFGSGKPGTSGGINIRGNTSINGGGPLILIDGVLGTLDRVNVNDVASVTVLKDASAAAVYGARGAFGVILITTKQAKVNQGGVTYTTNIGFVGRSTNTDFITSGYWNAKINDDAMYNALGYGATRYTDEDYEELLARVDDKVEDPSRPWVVIKQNASGQDMYRYYANFDWYNYFYAKNRPKQDHNLTLSGASGKTNYMVSGAYSKERGVFNINPDEYKRYNMRAKINTEVNKWLSFSNNTHFFKSSYDWHGFSTNLNAVSNDVSNDPIYHYHAAYVPRNPDGTLTGYTGINSYPIGYGLHNALEDGTMKGYDNGTELSSTSEVVLKLAKGLTLTGNYTYREYRSEYSYRQTKAYYSKYPGIMELSSLGALKTDKLNETMSKYYWNFVNVFGNYETSFGEHNLKLMAGFNQEDRTYKRVGGNGQELLSETLNDLSLVTGEKLLTGGADEWAVRGGFYRFNYDYKGKYLFETSGRYDGTSRFPKNSRFGFFPSFSAGWRLSEENFFLPAKELVDNLKIRYSYGSLGNQEVATYAYISSMGTEQISYLVDNQRLNVTNNPAPVANSLTWESITTNNIGLDFDMLKSRFSLSADYYIRDTRKMLSVGKKLPSVFGASEPKENAADLRTKGFEVSLGWRDKFNLKGKPFSYGVTGILSDYTAKITKFDNPAGLLSTYYVGQQLGDIWGYSYDGFFKTTEEAQAWAAIVNQDQINKRRVQAPTADLRMLQAGDIKILDLNGDGIINTGANTLDNPGDRRIIGNSQPRYSYGLTLNAQWSGFDFSIFFQGIGKQNWYPNKESQMFWHVYARPYDSFIPSNFQELMWSPDNPNAYFPFVRGYTAQNGELSVENDMYLQDLAYCKLRNLTIGYSLPNSLLSKIGISQIRVYFSGENLHTWTKLKTNYLDPEEVMSDPTGRTYPIGRTFSFGAQVSF